MSTSDLCQALLGQYPWTLLQRFTHNILFCEHYRQTLMFYTKTWLLYWVKAASFHSAVFIQRSLSPPVLKSTSHTHTMSLFMLHCVPPAFDINKWISLSVCAEALTESHLLHQATQRERGQEGGPGEETKSAAPGVTVDGPLQGLPEGWRARQAVHEGRKYNVLGKGWKLGMRRNENWYFLPDFVSLRVGWSLWAPVAGDGCEGAAETLPAASQTVSDHMIAYFVIISHYTQSNSIHTDLNDL